MNTSKTNAAKAAIAKTNIVKAVTATTKTAKSMLLQRAFGLALSAAILVSSLGLATTKVYAQCQNDTSGSSARIADGTQNTNASAPAVNTTDGAPEFVLQAQTGMAPRTFEHESFSMHSIVKSAVSVYPANAKDEISAYESLWFHDGKPVGLERNSALKIPADKSVEIKVVQSPCATFDESKAAANTIMRLVLDLMKNHDKVAKVSVPSASYTNILMELQRRRMSAMPPGEKAPETAKVKFKLESESTGMTQEVYFM